MAKKHTNQSKQSLLIAHLSLLLVPAGLAQMPTLTWDASQDLDGNNEWTSVEDPLRTWTLAEPAVARFGPTDFPGAPVWFNSLSGTQDSLESLGGTLQNVTWELVIRPVDFDDNHVIFETGGNGFGTAFVMQGADLEFLVQAANNDEQRIIATHTFAAGDEAKFHHVVASVTLGEGGTNNVDLYVNAGPPVASLGTTGLINDWAGGDGAGVGRLLGGIPTGQTGFANFAGDLALIRYYQDTVMTQEEVQAKFDDLSSGEVDSEPDGLPDFWEQQFFMNLDSDATDDNDSDTLSNEEEFAAGTDPTKADTDGDTLTDAEELNADPATSPTLADTDADGLDDKMEIDLGTDPTNPDSDNDGLSDGLEVENNTDPKDPNSPGAGNGATVIWITENTDGATEPSPDDSGWTDLLKLKGLDVERRDIRDLDANPTALDDLNAADLVIVSRDTNSGNYNTTLEEVSAWNTDLTTPLIQMSIYLARNNRWSWLNTTGVPVAGGNEIQATDPAHPIFSGITLDENQQFTIVESRQVNISDTPDVGNGTILATDPVSGNIWISYWEEGVEFYEGAGQTTGGPRLWFGAATDINNPKGAENFTSDGESAFINAVNFMLGNAVSDSLRIESIEYNKENDTVTLTWNSKESATYGVFFSSDLRDFSTDVDDAFPSQGETTSFTFPNPTPGAAKLFFRVVEN
jgi:hypothetical protein